MFITAIFLHLLATFSGVFYLNPEVSLYPYLVSRGLVPYLGLVDQHFPLIFFGPLNLSQIAATTPIASLVIYLVLILSTDLVAFLFLRRRQPTIFISFVIISFLLGVRTLWLETFVLFFLVSYFYFNRAKWLGSSLIAGLFLSISLAVRPTLAPFVLLLLLFNSRHRLAQFAVLPVIPLLQLIWLNANGLLPAFLEISRFNTDYYLKLAGRLPSFPEILIVGICASLLLAIQIHAKIRLLIFGLPLLLLALPRFELYHLLPLSALCLLPVKISPKQIAILKALLVLAVVFVTVRKISWPPVNFYYQDSLYQQAAALDEQYLQDGTVYFFGGPDQLYQLTNTVPTGNYYLPSLPWYLANTAFTGKQIEALRTNPQSPVVVNTDSRLAGVSLLDYGQPIWEYIQMHYQKIGSIDNLDIYIIRN